MTLILSILFLFTSTNQNIQFQDSNTGQAIEGVLVLQENGKSLISDASGWIKLNSDSDSLSITVFAYGYKSESMKLAISSESIIIQLKRLEFIGPDIIVNDKTRQPGEYRISNRSVEELPTFLGQKDVIKNLQRLPSVTTGLEGSTDYFVKGGNRGQNLLLFHDIPLQKFFHAGGLLSTISTEAIGNARFYASHVPAELGNAVSSVLELSAKEATEPSLTLETGLLTAGAFYESEFLMIGTRTSTLNNYLKILDVNDTYNFPETQFQDGLLQFRWGKPTNRWYVTSIFTTDRESSSSIFTSETEQFTVRSSNENRFAWQQGGVSLSNRYTLPKWVIKSGLAATTLQQQTNWEIITETSSKLSQDYEVRNYRNRLFLYSGFYHNNINFGAVIETASYDFEGEFIENGESRIRKDNNSVETIQFFTSWNSKFGDGWKVNVGIRPIWLSSLSSIPDIQPRANLQRSLNDQTQFFIGFAQLIQDYHYVPSPGFAGQNDLLFAPSELLPVERSKTFYVGWNQQFIKFDASINSEIYFRQFDNLISLRPGTSLLSPFEGLEDVLITGNGQSFGLSLAGEGSINKLEWTTTINLSKTVREFDELNFGESHPSKFDRPVVWQVDLRYALSKRWVINSAFSLSSSHLITIPEGRQAGVFFPPEPQYGIRQQYQIVSSVNNFRLPVYHRLDVGASYTVTGKTDYTLSIGVFNVYNRFNPQDYRYFGLTSQDVSRFTAVYLFPFTPYVTLSWKI